MAIGGPRVPSHGSETMPVYVAVRSLLPVTLRLLGGVHVTLEDDLGEWEVGMEPMARAAEVEAVGGVGGGGIHTSGDVHPSAAAVKGGANNGDVWDRDNDLASPSHRTNDKGPAGRMGGGGGVGGGAPLSPGSGGVDAMSQQLELQPGRWERVSATVAPRYGPKCDTPPTEGG